MKLDNLGWLDEAVEIDYLNKSMDRQGYKITHLILHGTAGGTSAQIIANYFANGSEQASAHFVIGTDGTIVQGIPCSLAAWANGPIDGTPADNLGFRTESDGVHRDSWWTDSLNPNYVTVSIEHCKPSNDNSDSLTAAQQESSFKLIECLCNTYGIPKRFADASGGVTGHFSMSAINRQHCPGPYPWQELFSYLNSGNQEDFMATIDITTPGLSNYFKASSDDKTWLCTNGYVIGGAILDFYKKFGGTALCGLTYAGLPLSNEIGIGGGRTMQRYERVVLIYDPSHTIDNPPGSGMVYVAHIDKGVGEDPRVEDLQHQVAVLQGQLDTNTQSQKITALEAKIAQAVKALS